MWRWALRGMMIGVVVVCALLWATSYFRTLYVAYDTDVREFFAYTLEGGLYLNQSPGEIVEFQGWDFEIGATEKRPDSAPWYYLGFNGGTLSTSMPLVAYFVRVPLWFLTAASAGLAWWIWRKTRRKTGGGFPVEGASGVTR